MVISTCIGQSWGEIVSKYAQSHFPILGTLKKVIKGFYLSFQVILQQRGFFNSKMLAQLFQVAMRLDPSPLKAKDRYLHVAVVGS